MKVSDPIIFGHAVEAFFPALFAEHGAALEAAGISANDGLGNLLDAVEALPDDERAADRGRRPARAWPTGPRLAMVDSDQRHHQPARPERRHRRRLDAGHDPHVGPDVERRAGEQQDTKAVIPDSSYAGIYQVVIDDCRAHGAYDPATMGSVPNVGLMAQKAEEYGSHDKTFEIPTAGTVRVVDGSGTALLEHTVEAGDIWRMCQAKDAPDPGLGEAGRHPGPRHRRAGRVLARRGPGPTTPRSSPRSAATSPTTTPTGCRSRSWRRSRPSPSRSSASAGARTRSRSPATCSATTSPTCSRSSSWAPAPRCSRSCRS